MTDRPMKRFRLLLIHVAGRMNRNNCVMGCGCANNTEALQRMQKVWKVFELPTQPPPAKHWGAGRLGSAHPRPSSRTIDAERKSVSCSGSYAEFRELGADLDGLTKGNRGGAGRPGNF